MRSSMWMLLNSAVTRAIAFLAQLALAFLLTRSDFGVYAASMSVAALLTSFRGAGMGQWLIQGGSARFEERAGDAFWTSLVFNLLLGGLIMGLAAPAADFFGDARVQAVVLVSGARFRS